MSNLALFNFEGANVRVVDMNGEPWFVGKDVADILGYANTSKAIATHCKAVDTCPTEMGGQVRHVQIIPERDVYRLVMRSKLPAAEQFEEWVVGTVLPSVRKHGGYIANQEALTPEQIMANGLKAAESIIAEKQQMIERQEVQILEFKPKAEALDRIATADGSLCITNAAKDLQVRPKDLFSYLSRNKWIYKRTGSSSWTAYQDKIQQGLLEHKTTEVTRSDGSVKVTDQVRVLPKGLAKLAQLIAEGDVA